MIPCKTYIPHIPAFVYLVCFFSAKVYCPRIIFMALFSIQFSSLHYFILSVYTNLNFNRMFSSTFQVFLQNFNKKYYNLTFLHQFFNTCYLFGRNGANVCDTQYLHSNRWWHNTIWWWRKHIPCIFIQGNYQLWKLSLLARKDHCFRPYFFVNFL